MAQHDHDDRRDGGGATATKRRRPVRAVLLSALVLVVLAAVVAGGYVFALARSFESQTGTIASAFPEESLRPAENSTGAVNILLLGSDSRDTSGDSAATGGLPNSGRSDTMMLVHIPGDRSGIYVTSIMRDTWVEIPGHGTHKINAAFALGGVPLAVQTIETLLDTRIDHIAAIDMEGFKGLTDALGGVEVNVPIAFNASQLKGHHFAEGEQLMSGAEALAFVRERKAFADGDYQRVRNQQVFLKAVLGELTSRDTLTNPFTVFAAVDRISPYIAVDDSLNTLAVGRLGLAMAGARSGDMHFFTLPTLGTGRSADGQSIVLPDTEAITALAEALANDDVAGFVEDHGL